MKVLKVLLKKAWCVYWYFISILFFFLFYPLFLILLSNEKLYVIANKLRVLWSKLVFLFTGILHKITYNGTFYQEYFKIKNKGPYIFCANHTSYLDIPLMAIGLHGRKWRYMAKAELLKIPIFNIFFKTVDFTVNRMSNTDSYEAFLEARKSLEKGYSVIIFPEGTISLKAPNTLPLKSGPFKLAIVNNTPIVPVTFLDNWQLFHDDGKQMGRPGIARAIFHEPIKTDQLSKDDVEQLKEKVAKIISEPLKQAYGN